MKKYIFWVAKHYSKTTILTVIAVLIVLPALFVENPDIIPIDSRPHSEIIPSNVVSSISETKKIYESVQENTSKHVTKISGNKNKENSGKEEKVIVVFNECHNLDFFPLMSTCEKVAKIAKPVDQISEIEILIQVLYDSTNSNAKINAIRKLGVYRTKESYNALYNATYDSDPKVRYELLNQIYQSLPSFRNNFLEIRVPFEVALSDRNVKVAQLAKNILDKIDDLSQKVESENLNLTTPNSLEKRNPL